MSDDLPVEPVTRLRDGHEWQIASAAEVAWITDGTRASYTVNRLLTHALLGARTRRVNADEDATPPGHQAH
jgi:hypothetical protein